MTPPSPIIETKKPILLHGGKQGEKNMKAELVIRCEQCGKALGKVLADTADMPEALQDKVNKVILAHRADCRYYKAVTA